jgi:hypothetical protein
MHQLAQSALCNRFHTSVQRLELESIRIARSAVSEPALLVTQRRCRTNDNAHGRKRRRRASEPVIESGRARHFLKNSRVSIAKKILSEHIEKSDRSCECAPHFVHSISPSLEIVDDARWLSWIER